MFAAYSAMFSVVFIFSKHQTDAHWAGLFAGPVSPTITLLCRRIKEKIRIGFRVQDVETSAFLDYRVKARQSNDNNKK
jgi:hypothetical protein